MKDYMHSDYAGNLADCHKHQWLCYLLEQQRPSHYLETHAGSGCYRLQDGGRWQQGIGQLWPLQHAGLSTSWSGSLQTLNPAQLTRYPGSPWLAQQILGPAPLLLFELDMETADRLRDTLPEADVRTGDGFSSVVHLLESDCLLMVDPPYNDVYDFDRAMMLMNLVLQRADCTLLLWYPRFCDGREQPWLDDMATLAAQSPGHAIWRNEITFANAQGALQGSGVWVVGADQPEPQQLHALSEQFATLGATILTIPA